MILWIKKLLKRKTVNGVSIKLSLFLEEYLVWAKKIAPRQGKNLRIGAFITTAGLCENLRDWCSFKGISYNKYRKLGKELQELFMKEELCRMYPFGQNRFWDQIDKGTLHEDPLRLSFCEKYSKKE